jgi:hypothetical protein
MGEPDRIDHDERDDLLERDRHHGEVVAAKTKRRHAEHGAGRQRHQASGDQAKPIADLVVGSSDSDRIGAEPEKCRLRQIDLAAEAKHDRQAEHRDRKGRGLHQDVVDIAVELERGGERHHDRGADEIRQVTQQQRFCARHRGDGRHILAGGAHAFSATRSPKMP